MILREDSESKNNRIITEILGRTNDSRKLSYQEKYTISDVQYHKYLA